MIKSRLLGIVTVKGIGHVALSCLVQFVLELGWLGGRRFDPHQGSESDFFSSNPPFVTVGRLNES